MRRASAALLLGLAAGCVTSYDELPLCAGIPGDVPTTSCRTSEEVQAYQLRLAHEILRWTQWEYPREVTLRVHLNRERRIDRVCLGSEEAEASWSHRDRVAASLRRLRKLEPGPACLAETTLPLTGELVASAFEPGANIPLSIIWCEDGMNRCTNRTFEVCGFFRNGRRLTYDNACEACQDPRVIGYMDFECGTQRTP